MTTILILLSFETLFYRSLSVLLSFNIASVSATFMLLWDFILMSLTTYVTIRGSLCLVINFCDWKSIFQWLLLSEFQILFAVPKLSCTQILNDFCLISLELSTWVFFWLEKWKCQKNDWLLIDFESNLWWHYLCKIFPPVSEEKCSNQACKQTTHICF